MYSRVGVDSECKMKMIEKIGFFTFSMPVRSGYKSFGSMLQLLIHTYKI